MATQAIPHPGAPVKPPVRLKGRYAIRPDGRYFLNNPQINNRTDLAFMDTLPEHVTKEVERIKALRAKTSQASARADAERAEFEAQRKLAAEAAEAQRSRTLAEVDATNDAQMAKFVVATADRSALVEFARSRYNVRLDGRKALDTLRDEVEALEAQHAL